METSGIGLFFQEGGVAVIILTTKLARDDFYSKSDFFSWLISGSAMGSGHGVHKSSKTWSSQTWACFARPLEARFARHDFHILNKFKETSSKIVTF